MEKLRVFVDTNVIVSYLLGEGNLVDLFSEEVLEKVQYFINPIVYQETILAIGPIWRWRLAEIELNRIADYVEVVQIDSSKMDSYLEKVQKFRNLLVHTNDILILQTAISQCDYLLTLDHDLLEISQIDSLRIISPSEYFSVLGVRQ